MSTLAVEIIDLADNDQFVVAVLYLLSSLLVAFGAYTAMFRVGRRVDDIEAQR